MSVVPVADPSTGAEVIGPRVPRDEEVLTPAALRFTAGLVRAFRPRLTELLAARAARRQRWVRGEPLGFLPETAAIRERDWQVAAIPGDLLKRSVEITGPVDRKMIINALNSGADVFMADFEDSTTPTWQNLVAGQVNLRDAVRRVIALDDAESGKHYQLHPRTATLMVRPRGLHLPERHVVVDGAPAPGAFVDFALFVFHNARELLDRGTGPYFYLPKLESHLEARLWNDVFLFAQDALGIQRGTIRATVLIETILAAFEMDEILYELREHAAGLNAGRWDYIFSIIKKFNTRSDCVLPDRAQITMTVPFMRAYAELLVSTCHKRGAHAMGGMAAFIPSRRDQQVNALALTKVREDKVRESTDGFDGTWVAHPDLVPVAREVFDGALGSRPNQKQRLRSDVRVGSDDILDFTVPDGSVTEAGVRTNVSVALQYLEAWMRGSGAVAINNLMEDTATAEISRAQLWQWLHHRVSLADGGELTRSRYRGIVEEELRRLHDASEEPAARYDDAAELLSDLTTGEMFPDFLTIPGARYLEAARATHGER